MKKILHLFTFLIGLTILFSCESSRAENGDLLNGINGTESGPGSGGGASNDKVLKKVTSTDSDGISSVINYNYTAGKLTTVKVESDGKTDDYTLSYENNVLSQLKIVQKEGATELITTLNITYNGGNVAKATGNIESGGTVQMKNATNFTYDSTGKLKKANTVLSVEDPENPGTYQPAATMVSDLLFAGNNLSQWKMTMTNVAPPPIVIPPVVVVANLSNYEINKNPFATLPIEFTVVAGHFMTGTNSFTGLSMNNYRSTTVNTSGVSYSTNYAYTYDSAGYPTKAVSPEGTLTFEYIKL